MKPKDVRWRHWLNPCDIDRAALLTSLGDWMDAVASECGCCNTGRVVIAVLVTAPIFYCLGRLMS